jgi:hypothetical protein
VKNEFDLNIREKIGLLTLFVFAWCLSPGQSEGVLLPLTHKLFINPSFAGLNKNSTLWTGMQFEEISANSFNHSHLLAYDFYSEKLKGGLAFYYIQEFYGLTNLNNTGTGFTYAGKVSDQASGQVIMAANLNYFIGTKQWFVHTSEGLIDKPEYQNGPPGEEFHRHNTFVPQISFLWSSDFVQTGIAARFPFRNNNVLYDTSVDMLSPCLVIYLSKINPGIKNGLISKPFEANPEASLLYAENTLLTRAGIRVTHQSHNWSVFSQNDFKKQIYGVSGILGWNLNNLRFSLSLGCLYSTKEKKLLLSGEAGLGLFIEGINNDENKPWVLSKY